MENMMGVDDIERNGKVGIRRDELERNVGI